MRTKSLRLFREILDTRHTRIANKLVRNPESRMRAAEEKIRDMLAAGQQSIVVDGRIGSFFIGALLNSDLSRTIAEYQEAAREARNLERHREEWEKESALLELDVEELDTMIEKVEAPLFADQNSKATNKETEESDGKEATNYTNTR